MVSRLERFMARWVRDESGCWIWKGADNGLGYCAFLHGKDRIYAHRFSYRQFVGEIPSGLEVDHICRVRRCVNPLHLQLLTHKENLGRILFRPGPTPGTHCRSGHEFTPANTYVKRRKEKTVRACVECQRGYVNAHRMRKVKA